MDKNGLLLWLENHKDMFYDMSDQIWGFAEPAYKERQSAGLQEKYLRESGFIISSGIADIPTAFSARWGNGKPVIAFLGEYDALEGLSQEAGETAYRPVAPGMAGHGCGHNLLGTAGVAAAAAVKEYLCQNNIPGSVRYYGCPAEEGGAGKVFMAKTGCFDDVDAAITWHPSDKNVMFTTKTLANYQVKFRFEGISSHASASPHMGRSALDALELMNVAVNFLREHIIQSARVHYSIVNTGGMAPNVVQAEAEAIYLIRAPHIGQVREIYERILKIAKGAALMTETKYSVTFQTGVSEYLPNEILTDILEKNFRRQLPIKRISEDNITYIKKLRTGMNDEKLISTDEDEDFIRTYGYCNRLMEQDGSSARASTDVGDVSWLVPTVQFEAACYAYGTSSHSWQRTAQGKEDLAHRGMLTAASAMAMTAFDIFESPQIIEAAKQKHEIQKRGIQYTSPIPDSVKPEL